MTQNNLDQPSTPQSRMNRDPATAGPIRVWFSARAAGRYLELSRKTVGRLLREGKLKSRGFAGGQIRIHREDLDHYIQTSEQNARWAERRRQRQETRRIVEGMRL